MPGGAGRLRRPALCAVLEPPSAISRRGAFGCRGRPSGAAITRRRTPEPRGRWPGLGASWRLATFGRHGSSSRAACGGRGLTALGGRTLR
eukprot:10948475-Alexandrium_andersonii.AAC.1